MRCNEFHERLNCILDRRADPSGDAWIGEHASACEDCASALRGVEKLRIALRAAPANPLVDPRKARRREFFPIPVSRRYTALASALALLTALFVANSHRPITLPNTPPPTVQATIVGQSEPQQLRAVNQESVAAHLTPNYRPRGNIVVQPILGLGLVAQADWTKLSTVPMPFGVKMPPLETEWLEDVAREMQPIRQSVDRTVDVIFRSLRTS